jgi:hypothetical protein
MTNPDVVGWFLGGQKVPGLVSVFFGFLSYFGTPLTGKRPKNVIKEKSKKNVDFFSIVL